MARKQSPAMVAAQAPETRDTSRKRQTGARSHQKRARSNAAAAEAWATGAAARGSAAAIVAGAPEGAPTLPGALPDELEPRGRTSSPDPTPQESEVTASAEEAHTPEELEDPRGRGSPPEAPPREAEVGVAEKEAHCEGEALPSLELSAAGGEAPTTQYFDLTTNMVVVDSPVSQEAPATQYFELTTNIVVVDSPVSQEAPATQYFELTTNIIGVDAPVSQEAPATQYFELTTTAACGSAAAVAAGTPEGTLTLPGALPEELVELRGRTLSPVPTPQESEVTASAEEARTPEELEEPRSRGSPPEAPPREAEVGVAQKEGHSEGEALPSLELSAADEEAPTTQYFDLTTNMVGVDAPVSQETPATQYFELTSNIAGVDAPVSQEAPVTQYFELTSNIVGVDAPFSQEAPATQYFELTTNTIGVDSPVSQEAPTTQYFELTTNIIGADAPVSQCNSPPSDEEEPMPQSPDLATPAEEEEEEEQDGALVVTPLRLDATTEEEQEEGEVEETSTPLLDDIDVTVAVVETPALGPTPPEKELGICIPSNSATEDAEADSQSEDSWHDSEMDDDQSERERCSLEDEREPNVSSEAGEEPSLALAAGAGPTAALSALSFDLTELNRESEPLSTSWMGRKEAPLGSGEKPQKLCSPAAEPDREEELVSAYPLKKLHAALAIAALPEPDPEQPSLSARGPAGGDAHEQAMRVGDEDRSLKDIFALPSTREMWQGSGWKKFSLTAVLADWSAEMASCVGRSLREEDQEMKQPAQPSCLPRASPALS